MCRKLLAAFLLVGLFGAGWRVHDEFSLVAPPEYGVAPEAHDALDEVNAARAKRGLRPYVKDAKLTEGAKRCAAFRADHLCRAHTKNDFAFLPEGTGCMHAGCGALPDSWGWAACFTYDAKFIRAGAAWARGRDGKRYMSLFVSN